METGDYDTAIKAKECVMENQSLEAAKSRKYKMEQLEKRLQESFNAMVKVAEEDSELSEVLSSICFSNLLSSFLNIYFS